MSAAAASRSWAFRAAINLSTTSPMVPSALFAAGFLFKLFEHLGGVPVASCRQPAELIEVARLAGCFHQLVRRVAAARVSQPPEFVQVPPLGGTLNQFIDGVGLAAGRPLP